MRHPRGPSQRDDIALADDFLDRELDVRESASELFVSRPEPLGAAPDVAGSADIVDRRVRGEQLRDQLGPALVPHLLEPAAGYFDRGGGHCLLRSGFMPPAFAARLA